MPAGDRPSELRLRRHRVTELIGTARNCWAPLTETVAVAGEITIVVSGFTTVTDTRLEGPAATRVGHSNLEYISARGVELRDNILRGIGAIGVKDRARRRPDSSPCVNQLAARRGWSPRP